MNLRDASKHEFAALFYDCIIEGAAGKVLVMASCGHEDTSLGGGVKLSRVENNEIDSIINDAMQIERADQLSIEQIKREGGA